MAQSPPRFLVVSDFSIPGSPLWVFESRSLNHQSSSPSTCQFTKVFVPLLFLRSNPGILQVEDPWPSTREVAKHPRRSSGYRNKGTKFPFSIFQSIRSSQKLTIFYSKLFGKIMDRTGRRRAQGV